MKQPTGRELRTFCYAMTFCLVALSPYMFIFGLFLCLMDIIDD